MSRRSAASRRSIASRWETEGRSATPRAVTTPGARISLTPIRHAWVADPHAIHKVDQLAYDDANSYYSWGKRSISVTQDRIYVAGPEWGSSSEDHSTTQVVDITDPAGDLVQGASVPVKGQIESRWQMDEYQGVLRVVSQSGSWSPSGIAPVVETCFDGIGGYAVTFQQTDPLFTLDLSDPANPKQVGELQMPGYPYHMEPRGDRMIALGLDNNNPQGGVTVSVFDVANLAAPSLLSRVNFGGDWGWMAEDQDRIQKAFRIFDADHLIVVPFSGYTYNNDPNCFDLHGDTLAVRGLVPQYGQARRAFLHASRLLAVSDQRVSASSIGNRATAATGFRSPASYAVRWEPSPIAPVPACPDS